MVFRPVIRCFPHDDIAFYVKPLKPQILRKYLIRLEK